MPWCDDCNRFYAPAALENEVECPTCHRVIARPPEGEEGEERAPWHFKLLVAASAVYLAYRAWQGVVWIVHH